MAGIIKQPDKNTAEIIPLVHVSVEADEDTVGRYVDWLKDNCIFGVRGYGYADPYTFAGFYTSADAERIRQWCTDNGVEVT